MAQGARHARRPRMESAAADVAARPGQGAQFAESLKEGAARRGKSRDVGPLRALLPYIARRRTEALLAGVFLVLAAGATLAVPLAARQLVDQGLSPGDIAAANQLFLGLFAVAVALAIFSAVRFYWVSRLGERVTADIRIDVFAKLMSLSPAWFQKTRVGEAVSRLTVDVTLIETLVGSSASMALRNILMMVGGLALMAMTSLKLTGLALLVIPAILIPVFVFGRRVRKLSTAAQDRIAEAAAAAGESLDALETIQAFTAEDRARARFAAAAETAFDAARRRIMARAFMTAIVITVVFGGIALVLWEGANTVIGGDMTPGALTQFVILAVMTASGAGVVAEVWGDVQRAAGAMQRISEILAEVPDIAAPAAPAVLPPRAKGHVRFEDVAFAYPDASGPALNGVSFEARPGETLALVGPSGAGKSTVFRLALRLADPTRGRILLDGIDARDADPRDWRARFSWVSQQPDLFTLSAAQNIALGAPDADTAAIARAAARAEADGFLSRRTGGIDGGIGDRGRGLSGGERQRVAIARALLRDAPVLLLDEATSALDAENERLIQKALDGAMEGRTTLVIAHRLATVRRANRILVFDQGRIVEDGDHDSLVAAGGLYARLARLQFADGAAMEPA